MKFSILASTVFSALSLVSTAATVSQDAHLEARHHRQGEYHITPKMTIVILQGNPDKHMDPSTYGIAAKWGNGHDIHTLISFDVPHNAHGKKCRLFFKDPDWVYGTGKLNVYHLKEAFNDAASWNYKPPVGHLYASFKAEYGEDFAEAEYPDGKWGFFDCPNGKSVYYEVQPHGKHDVVNWHQESDPHDTPGFTLAVIEPGYDWV